jgi:hypothetical protein
MQRPHQEGLAAVRIGVERGELLADGLDLGVGGQHRDSVAQPGEAAEIVAVALFGLLFVEGFGQPDLAVLRAHPWCGEIETGRHDADDGDIGAVEPDGATDERRIAAEALLPEFPGDDGDGRGAGGAVGGLDPPAAERCNAEGREHTLRGAHTRHGLGVLEADIDGAGLIDAEMLERSALCLEILVVGRR